MNRRDFVLLFAFFVIMIEAVIATAACGFLKSGEGGYDGDSA
jgi:hypothetical protein